jgi:hypothetical protein
MRGKMLHVGPAMRSAKLQKSSGRFTTSSKVLVPSEHNSSGLFDRDLAADSI